MVEALEIELFWTNQMVSGCTGKLGTRWTWQEVQVLTVLAGVELAATVVLGLWWSWGSRGSGARRGCPGDTLGDYEDGGASCWW